MGDMLWAPKSKKGGNWRKHSSVCPVKTVEETSGYLGSPWFCRSCSTKLVKAFYFFVTGISY